MNRALWILLIVIAIFAVAGFIHYWPTANTDSSANLVVNANIGTNTNSITNNIGATVTNVTVNTSSTSNANTTSITNANVDAAGWKTYTNTKYGYSVRVPQSWGRISELDGSVDTNLSKQSTQEAVTLSLGPSDGMAKGLFIAVDENKTLDQFLKEDMHTTGSGAKKFILGSSDFTIATGIPCKRVDLEKSYTGFDFAYVFSRGSNLVDLRFLKQNKDALNVINTLKFTN